MPAKRGRCLLSFAGALMNAGLLRGFPAGARFAPNISATLQVSGNKTCANHGANIMDMVRRNFAAFVGFTGRFPTPRMLQSRTEGQPRQCRTMLWGHSVNAALIGVGGATIKNTSRLCASEKWRSYPRYERTLST